MKVKELGAGTAGRKWISKGLAMVWGITGHLEHLHPDHRHSTEAFCSLFPILCWILHYWDSNTNRHQNALSRYSLLPYYLESR
jgi:hypothetical protein